MRHGEGGTLSALMLDGPDGPALPRLESADRRAADVSELTTSIRAAYGLEVSVLRCLSDEPADGDRPRHQVHLVEAHAGETARGRWLPLPAIASAASCAVRRAIDTWERAAGAVEWTRPGWRDEVRVWIDRELSRRDLGTVRAMEQVRVWETSQVLRVDTGAARFYFKARPEAGVAEAPLTRFLAARHPAWMPVVVAIEPERRWLLMREAPGPPLMEVGDVARWEEAAAAIARIQLACLATAELTALGCPRAPLAALGAGLARLLDDVTALQPGGDDSLTDAQVATLRGRRDELAALCGELDALGVPESLEHGDLWAANVIAGDGRVAILDWEDATIAHPFISASLLLVSVPYAPALGDHAAARQRIRDAYLAPWVEDGPLHGWPPERAAGAFALAQRVAMLHYAVRFHLGLPAVETSRELRQFVPFFLGKLLAS